MKALATISVVALVVVSACATGALPTNEDAGGHDTGVTNKDSGSDASGNDGSSGKDSNVPDVIDTCQKAPPSDICGVFPQCDCPANQTCEVNQTMLNGSSSCIQAGTLGIGQPCTATVNQCAPGLTCIWNECHPYCGTAGTACTNPGTNNCVNLTDSMMNPIPNLLVCHIDCALQDASSCGGGSEGCIYFSDGSTDCYPVGTATTCSATTECKPGDVCVFDGVSTYTCDPWCRIGLNDCTIGTCNAFGTPPTVNGQAYGYCQ
jgi:hypothetical protein